MTRRVLLSLAVLLTGACSSDLGRFCVRDSDCSGGLRCLSSGLGRGVCAYLDDAGAGPADRAPAADSPLQRDLLRRDLSGDRGPPDAAVDRRTDGGGDRRVSDSAPTADARRD